MKRRLLLPILLPASLLAQQELSVSVSNLMRYGSSTEVVNPLYMQKEYFENLLDARIGYGNFLLGFRLLHDAPPENGVDSTGIAKRYLEFTKDDLTVRAGNSYSLYGRGLALNLFEKRTLAFDTGLDGFKALYQTRLMKATTTIGRVIYHDVNTPLRVETYQIRAGSVELMPYPFLTLGGDFTSGGMILPGIALLPTAGGPFTGRFDIPDYFAGIHTDLVEAFIEYAEKRTEAFPNFLLPRGGHHVGTGFYGSLSYSQEDLGVTLEYKDYRFGIADPISRTNADQFTKALAIQNPPIVHKEHSFTLASRYPHVIDFGDEIGFQTDAYYTVGQLTGNLNFAAASRHCSFSPTGDSSRATGNPNFRSELHKGILPSFQQKFSPFWEFYGDFQYYFEAGGNDYAEVAFNRRQQRVPVEVRAITQPLVVQLTDVIGVPLAAQYTIGDGWVAKVIVERQWVQDDTNPQSAKFFNQFFSLGISRSPGYSVTVRYEFTSDKDTQDGREDWPALDFGFWLGKNHNITLTAGGDRGGLVCSNGVCRTVPPFLGFRASITSYL